MSGHVLKTFPASIPATVTPVIILKAIRCRIRIIFPLADFIESNAPRAMLLSCGALSKFNAFQNKEA